MKKNIASIRTGFKNTDGKIIYQGRGLSFKDVVEQAVKHINQDILFEKKFERVKTFVINKYKDLADSYQGVQVYDSLVSETLTYTNNKVLVEIPMKFLIVYIFDKCDIFKKE